MKNIALGVMLIAGIAGASSADARSSRTDQMLKLDPATRIEQRCDARAMGIVGREHKGYRPDEFVAYAFADPVMRGTQIKAPGGAIRSAGRWYKLSYVCETSSDGLDIKSFSYQLGAEVPRSEWDAHYLVPR
ncbi:DUF930 domain-containing protein [Rhodopseudomonas boonkerdii]|uniref:DUF930 domain-containing protein n=1 Tax=Rhodopseudomonas boonkerdii TaxID=475937 RepID=UPI001E572245|nr:DUF930 domain-containing protein [Rhodopseudomonas boonkerdii]UGV26711.1 DUF930 domain-containing protein [Rhodopseudomonas boonkerdii]